MSSINEIARAAFEGFLRAYLIDKSARAAADMTTENVQCMGSGELVVAYGRAELLRRMADELAGDQSMQALEIGDGDVLRVSDDYCTVTALVRIIRRGAEKSLRVVVGVAIDGGTGYISSMQSSAAGTTADEEDFLRLAKDIPCSYVHVLWEGDYPIVAANDYFYAATGFSAEGRLLVTDVIHPDDVSRFVETCRDAAAKHRIFFEITLRVIFASGKIVWVFMRCIFSQGDRGTILSAVCFDCTPQKRQEIELRLKSARLDLAIRYTAASLFDYDVPNGLYIDSELGVKKTASPAVIKNYPQCMVASGAVSADSANAYLDAHSMIREGRGSAVCTVKMRAGDGSYVWNKLILTRVLGTDQHPLRAIGVIIDVSREMELQLAYLREEQYRIAMMSQVKAYMEIDLSDDTIENATDTWGVAQPLQGQSYTKAMKAISAALVVKDDKKAFYSFVSSKRLLARRAEPESPTLEFRVNDGGAQCWVLGQAHMFSDNLSGKVKCFLYLQDINSKKNEELRLITSARRDSLTGLLNKGMTEEEIQGFLQRSPDKSRRHAFMIIDLDHFKEINDSYGHLFGDRLLKETARRLSAQFRSDDIVGRIGGDEFAALLKNVRDEEFVRGKARGICAMLRQTFPNNISVSASIGVAICPKDGDSFEKLYKNADAALYASKESGRDRFTVYDKKLKGGKRTEGGQPASDAPADAAALSGALRSIAAGKAISRELELGDLKDVLSVSRINDKRLLYVDPKLLEDGGEDWDSRCCDQLLCGREEPCQFCNTGSLNENGTVWEWSNEFLGRHMVIKSRLASWRGEPVRVDELISDGELTGSDSAGMLRRLEREKALSRCLKAAAQHERPADTLRLALETLGGFYGADRASIITVGRELNRGSLSFEWCGQGVKPAKEKFRNIDFKPLALISRAITRQEPLTVEDIQDIRAGYPADYSFFVGQSIRAIMFFPFPLDEDTLLLVLDNPTRAVGDTELMAALSGLCVNACGRMRLSAAIERSSARDPLTDLRDRAGFTARLGDVIHHCDCLGVALACVKDLKLINIERGYDGGDEALRSAGQALKAALGDENVFRISSNDFGVLCPNVGQTEFNIKLKEAKAKMVSLSDCQLAIGSAWQRGGKDMRAMIREAGAALVRDDEEHEKISP